MNLPGPGERVKRIVLFPAGAIFLTLATNSLAAVKSAPPSPTPSALSKIANKNEPRVQAAWQEALLQYAATAGKSKEVRAWGLFTYSGWSNVGQFMVVHEGKERKFFRVPENYESAASKEKPERDFRPSVDKGTGQRSLRAEGWAYFRKELDASQWQRLEQAEKQFRALDDLPSKVFDGIEVEFVALHSEKGTVTVDKRVFMHAPNDKEGKKHQEALDSFLTWAAKLK